MGWELCDYAKRSAYRRSQYRGGVAAARGHSTKHSTGRRRQIQGRMAVPSPPPLPTRHHVKAHRTTLLAILHQPRGRGRYTTGRTGVGWGSPATPPDKQDRRDRRGGERKVYAQGGTGGL